MLRRLVVHEVLINRLLKLRMLHDGVRACPLVVLCHSRFVLCVYSIVSPAPPCLCRQFIRYRSLRHADAPSDLLLRVPFADKDMNLMPVVLREALFFCFFMRLSYQKLLKAIFNLPRFLTMQNENCWQTFSKLVE